LRTRDRDAPPAGIHADFLGRCQQRPGLLSDYPGQPANIAFNGLAALLALDRPELARVPWLGPLLSAVVDTRGNPV
jgi:hypothetical protein